MSENLPPIKPHTVTTSQPPRPSWTSGANNTPPTSTKITIDPYEEGRETVSNYRLIVSAVSPRPIALVSTVSKDGVRNLAPFSYFNLVNSDPPTFVIGFAAGRTAKDSCKNLLETGECTINIVGEWFVEAMNAACMDAPTDVDEWEQVGLNGEKSEIVKPEYVKESAFSVECKLVAHHDWFSKRDPSRQTGTMCIVEGVLFHVREDVVNENKDGVDLAKMQPVSRLGGITYGRTTEVYNLPRMMWKDWEEKKSE